VSLLSGVKYFDQHAVHVVSLDSVPEERDENEVVAEDVGDATAETSVGEFLSDVEYDQKNDQRHAQVQQNPSHSTATRFTTHCVPTNKTANHHYEHLQVRPCHFRSKFNQLLFIQHVEYCFMTILKLYFIESKYLPEICQSQTESNRQSLNPVEHTVQLG